MIKLSDFLNGFLYTGNRWVGNDGRSLPAGSITVNHSIKIEYNSLFYCVLLYSS